LRRIVGHEVAPVTGRLSTYAFWLWIVTSDGGLSRPMSGPSVWLLRYTIILKKIDGRPSLRRESILISLLATHAILRGGKAHPSSKA
jgi:hypothetical protein